MLYILGRCGRKPELKFKEVVVTSAQILTLNTIPVELIPAPGAGYFIHIINPVLVKLVFNTAVYAPFVNMIIYNNAALKTQIYLNNGILSAGVDVFEMMIYQGVAFVEMYQENSGMFLYIQTGNPMLGDSDIKLYFQYKIRPI